MDSVNLNVLVEICVHSPTPHAICTYLHNTGRAEGRVGGKFFGPDSKVLLGNTEAMLVTRLFESFDLNSRA